MKKICSLLVVFLLLTTMLVPAVFAFADEQYTLSFQVKFEANWFFSTYDVALYVDDNKVGEFKHGVDFTAQTTVSGGSHVITFCSTEKRSYDGTIDVTVNSNTKIDCYIHCHSGYINITDTAITPETATEIPQQAQNEVTEEPTNQPVTTAQTTELTDEVLSLNLKTATDEELEQAASLIKAEQRARMVTKINLDSSSVTLEKGKSQKITAEIIDLPDGVKSTKFQWDTSDKSVATCSNGTIKAVGPGTAVITCSMTLSDETELSSECSVEVVVSVSAITSSVKKLDLGVDQSSAFRITVKPDNATNKTISFVSSDTSVATVSQDGIVTGVGIGKATITATTTDGSGKSASCSVTVTKKDDVGVTKINDNNVSVTMHSVRTTKGSSYFKAENGNTYVIPTFEIANNGSSSFYFNYISDISAYCDGYSIDYSFNAACNQKNSLDGDLPSGKKMKGEYAMEVPEDWKEIEVHIKTSFLTDDLIFMIYNQ